MKKILLLLFITPFLTDHLFAQSYNESWKLYDDTQVARIDVTIDPAKLQWIYSNVESDSEHIASAHFKNSWIDETIDSIGFRLRGNTSRNAQKKSLKISFNTFVQGREFYGVDKLNLNGEHNDPSVIRSKLCWDLFKKIGMISSRASFAQVYINNQYYGLYISVEHLDDEFLKKNFDDDSGNLWKCLYPADLVYLGENPDLYKLIIGSRPVYELKTNEEINDFSQLARLIDIINNTPDNLLPDSLEKVLEVSEVLKYFAMNILTGSWDDYWSLMNNYYIYHNPSEDKFHWIPYDYDNTFGIDWFNIDWSSVDPYNFPKVENGERPLADRLMENAQYRNLYTHFLEFFREKVLKLNLWENRIDSLKNLITSSVAYDTFYIKDYGFNLTDFYQSYSASGYSNQHVKKGLKEFINLRYNSLPSLLNYVDAKPIVYVLDYSPKNPAGDDSIYITVSAFDNAGLSEVKIEYTSIGSTTTENYQMIYQPAAGTQNVDEADKWTGVIPPLEEGSSGSFKIFVKDLNNDSMRYPRDKSVFIKSPALITSDLVINEFMADNDNIIADDSSNFDDWVELYNPSSEDIILSGMFLTDKPNNLTKWQIPGDNLMLSTGEFLLIWCDEEEEQGDLHTNFGLSKDGEFIGLVSADGVTIIDSITFGPQNTDISYGRLPDATDNWQFFMQPTPGSNNVVVDINEDEQIPNKFELTAYPNPFNPTTKIRYTIPSLPLLDKERAGVRSVTLKIYDILGNEAATLVNEEKAPGVYEIKFDASSLTSGVYIYKLNAGNFTLTKKLLLLK